MKTEGKIFEAEGKKWRYVNITDKEVRLRVEKILYAMAFTILGMFFGWFSFVMIDKWTILIIGVASLCLGIFALSLQADKVEVKEEIKKVEEIDRI